MIELIAKDKNEKLQFEGKCKLRIDTLSKLLLVEHENEEFKMISAMFLWKFVAEKNILFIFAEHSFQDFALIFDDSRKCEKIYNLLLQKGATLGTPELVRQRFLPALFEEISRNDYSRLKFKELFFDWIIKHEVGEREEYIQIFKKHIYDDLCYPNDSETD
uniref:Uncharacterized protein n=1 Tax=Panagrolaimus sp. ES5 TaxID=591445 RepID=A0AC34G9R4_9BILA